ncbi:MAG TPA: hypothetical protein DCL43_11320 [Chitinophagaceae bacterium]|nr:hypothetical protein [Chitinophagaceae bacterium]HAN39911.1 hypothetical protein [Chitinophagaceae bacterium]
MPDCLLLKQSHTLGLFIQNRLLKKNSAPCISICRKAPTYNRVYQRKQYKRIMKVIGLSYQNNCYRIT